MDSMYLKKKLRIIIIPMNCFLKIFLNVIVPLSLFLSIVKKVDHCGKTLKIGTFVLMKKIMNKNHGSCLKEHVIGLEAGMSFR